ncbi:MAG: hypothetical protein IJ859_08505 [Synergistaceae bacterium]|nr:hypothetical protein [Synergistaceae bacterium]
MAKKILAFILSALFVAVLTVNFVSAEEAEEPLLKWTEDKTNRVFPVYVGLMEALENFGDDVLKNTKPIIETKLTEEERNPYLAVEQLYNRICIKDKKTFVLGSAGKDKIFETGLITTFDPDAINFERLKIGENISVLGSLLDTSFDKDYSGMVSVRPPVTDPRYVYVLCDDGIITGFSYEREGRFDSEAARKRFEFEIERAGYSSY